MYNLMLVDDESDIREGLQEIIHFEELGFQVVGEAENGIEALQICEALNPDVVITDIRMPLMDGITMCREMKKILPMAHFIILSGYDDFEYAQQAIEISSMRYLLKPITSIEFTKILTNIRKTLDEEFDQRRNLTMLKQHFQTSLPLLRDMMLSSLVSGAMPVDAAQRAAQRYSVDLEAKQYVVALLRIAGNGRHTPQGAIDDPDLLWVAIQNIAHDVLLRRHKVQFFHHNSDEIGILFLLPATDDAEFAGVLTVLEETQKNIEHYLSTKVYVGVSAPCSRLDQLNVYAKQALSALDQSSILADGQVVCVTGLADHNRQEPVADPQTLRALANALKTYNHEECKKLIDDLLDALVQSKPTPRMYRTYMIDVCVTLMRRARDIVTDSEEEPDSFEKTLDALMHCPPVQQARQLLYDYCDALIRAIDISRISSSQKLINQATEILIAHYDQEDMSIETICRQLHISTSYFSVLFKRETGKTFHQYLVHLRMDKAMTMLAVGMEKTAEVAQAVGIPDPSYFSYAFKKHFGMSPSQARRKRGQQDCADS